MGTRKASIKETGEELSQEEWERFDRAVAMEKARRREVEDRDGDLAVLSREEANAPRR